MQQFTDKAKAALQKAARAARDLHQSYIGSEHILVGLVKEKTGVAARVLAENGVDEVQLISMIKELIAPEGNVALLERDGYSPRATKVLEDSHRLAEKFKSQLTLCNTLSFSKCVVCVPCAHVFIMSVNVFYFKT